MKSIIRRFFADERGATSVEYAIIATGIAAAIIVTVSAVGAAVKTKYSSVNEAFGSN
jgi:pilus assembly protein Flp/PilA